MKDDGMDKTTNNEQETLPDVQEVMAEIDDEQKVKITYEKQSDDKGNEKYVPDIKDEDIPEGIEDIDLFKQEVLADNVVQELGATLSKYKVKRTEQNQFEKDYEDMKLKHQALQSNYDQLKTETDNLRLVAEKKDFEIGVTDFDSRVEKKTRELLGLKEDEELEDFIGTMKYQKAFTKAISEANVEALRSRESQTKNTLLRELSNNELRNIVSKKGQYKYDEVLSYAKIKGLEKLSPSEIYSVYDATHKPTNYVNQLNDIENIKSQTLKITRKGNRASGLTSLEKLPHEEALKLIQSNPDDPRVKAYIEKQHKLGNL